MLFGHSIMCNLEYLPVGFKCGTFYDRRLVKRFFFSGPLYVLHLTKIKAYMETRLIPVTCPPSRPILPTIHYQPRNSAISSTRLYLLTVTRPSTARLNYPVFVQYKISELRSCSRSVCHTKALHKLVNIFLKSCRRPF